MSIIVSVKINDGVVMAADSATTFYKSTGEAGQIYEHANKIVNLVKGLPIGVMTCGSGGVGSASIATLLKDLRATLSIDGERQLDPKNYTMKSVATEVQKFFADRAQSAEFKNFLDLRICGYSSNRPLPEVWEVVLNEGISPEPAFLQNEVDIGPRWNGESEALDRLIIGISGALSEGIVAEGILTKEQLELSQPKFYQHTVEHLILAAAPIQDAIDLARYMVETTKGFIRFSIKRTKTVGGPIEIAVITKHEGFKWVQRKHFYSSEINAVQ
jgi:20S proteasome alpha/beta subunit